MKVLTFSDYQTNPLKGSSNCSNLDIPHCPNSSCKHNQEPLKEESWFYRHGKYKTKIMGLVSRYQCKECKTTFSIRTFHIDYYTKLKVDYSKIFNYLVTTSGSGSICRMEGISDAVLLNRIERLSRMFLGIHSMFRELVIQQYPETKYVLDGFESFSHSQYHPNNINLLVGSSKEYIYEMGLSILKRKGTMTDEQRNIRDAMEEKHETNPQETQLSVGSLLRDILIALQQQNSEAKTSINKIHLTTDMHPSYPASIRSVDPESVFFEHEQISSKVARNYQNKLFVVNYCDRQIRKDQANHVRETVQFARCPQAMMARLIIYQFFHNYILPFRVKNYRVGDARSRIEWMGIESQKLHDIINQFCGTRFFCNKVKLWTEEKKTWFMEWRNPGILMTRYIPKYIFS